MGTKSFNNYADLITFSRASSATYLDSDGLLKTATTNTPRIEYDADGNRLGLLIEEQRTNLLTYSEDFSNAAWASLGGASITANQSAGPDGLSSMDRLSSNGSTSFPRISQDVSSSGTNTFSVFVKDDDAGEVIIRMEGTDVGGASETNSTYAFAFSTESMTNRTGGTALQTTVQSVGNGIYRISLTVTSSTIVRALIYPAFSSTAAQSLYIYGAQLEAGAFPTSYIPTSGSTATRAADVASIPVSDFGYNQNQGTVVVDVATLSPTLFNNPMAYNLNNGTSAERITVFGSSAQWRFVLSDGGVDQASIFAGSFGNAIIASSFEKNRFNHCVNGAFGTEDTLGTMPTITKLDIGTQLGGNVLNGHIKSIKYYPRRLTNDQLQELTQ